MPTFPEHFLLLPARVAPWEEGRLRCSSLSGPPPADPVRPCSLPRARWCSPARRATPACRPACSVADLAGDLPAVFGLGADPDVGPRRLARRRRRGPDRGARPSPDRSGSRRRAAAPWPRSSRAHHAPRARERRGPRGRAVAGCVAGAGRLRHGARARRRVRWSRSPTSRSSCCAGATSHCAARVHAPPLEHTAGVVLLDESGRSLGATEIGEVLDLPVLARVPSTSRSHARSTPACCPLGCPNRWPRPATDVIRRLGVRAGWRGEAA